MTDVPLDLTGLDALTEPLVLLALRLAGGDFAARAPVQGRSDGPDAVAVALNMLAESFEREHAARARAELLLADAVETYELAPDGFCSLDVESLRVVECNAALGRILGVSSAELYGRTLLDLMEPSSRAPALEALRRLAGSGEPPELDVGLASAGGRRIASMTGALKRDVAGQPLRLLLALRDETETRALSAQLAQAQRLDALGRLAGGVAHDFNNLLAIILTTVEVLARRLADRPAEREEAEVLRTTAERAAALVRDLLAFARQEELAVTRIALDDAVRAAEPMLGRLLGPSVELVLSTQCPGVEIVASSAQLGQALVNLALNARDAMPEGGRIGITTRRVAVSPQDRLELEPGAYAQIEVSDTGTGIAPEVQARIFDPFFTTKPVGRGTGLGLSIVYGMVRQARGLITLASCLGAGSTFTLWFPVAPATAPALASPPAGLPDVGAAQPFEQTTLLVAEDDDVVRSLTARVLRGAGFRVLEASSGDAAVGLVRDAPEVALVVSDVVMAGTDGVSALLEMRRSRPDLPCVFVTGFFEQQSRVRELSGVVILQKPCTPTCLIAHVGELLSGQRRPSAEPRG